MHANYRALIESRFGLRLTDHQARELDQKVARILALTGLAEAEVMWRAFRAGWRPDLLQTLVAELTIGETHFFRIEPQIAALREFILPDLIRRNANTHSVNLWSAGCSTGEEPYTLAMLVDELLARTAGWQVHIVATDLNAAALATARRAVYSEWSFRGTSDALRERYFVPDGTSWRLVEAVRGMVQFTNHNLVEDAGPGGVFDLILCRNVTIYFSPEATRRAYQTLASSLAPRGWLILGASDPTPAMTGLLEPMYLPGVVCWRRQGEPVEVAKAPPARVLQPTPRVSVPARPSVRERVEVSPLPLPAGDRASVLEQAERAAVDQPTSATAHLMLGMPCLDDGSIEAALTSLRRATFLDPDDPLAHFSLGRAWLLSGNAQRARASFLDARRQLVGLTVDAIVPGGGGTWASELRHATEAQLEALSHENAA
jgi:chemotaxis protein methyltransferase CheR